MNLRDLGEFGLIARLAEVVKPGWEQTHWRMTIGDDAAVYQEPDGTLRVWTADLLIEHIHFLPDTPLRDLGWKALAVNLSDLAAMGAEPLGALANLAIPAERTVEEIETLYRGMAECGQTYGCPLVGGDTTRSPGPLVVDVTVWGHTAPGRLRLRSMAQVGDLVAVTGTLGDSAAGLHRLLHPSLPAVTGERALRRAHLRPLPCLLESCLFSSSPAVHAMMDLSDGLAGDAGHLAARSGVRIRLDAEKIPLSRPLLRAAAAWQVDPLQWALHGGEDYQLLFTCAPAGWPELVEEVRASARTRLSVVGEVEERNEDGEVVLRRGESVKKLERGGWVHF